MRLKTLGGLALEGSDFKRPKPLLLLAYLSLEGAKDRRHVAELFWPEATNPMASLRTALAQLRRNIPEIVKGDESRLSAKVPCDARELLESLDRGELDTLCKRYSRPFLEGFYLHDVGTELEEWVYATREFIASRVREGLLRLAEREADKGHVDKAGEHADAAYALAGAPELDPEEFVRVYRLLLAGGSSRARNLRAEALSLGLDLGYALERTKAHSVDARGAEPFTLNNLPMRLTSFLGRDLELVEITNLLLEECRLLTLQGPGGVGKTRLALRVGQEMLGQKAFPDGVFFVGLDALTDPKLVPATIASSLNIPLHGKSEPLAQLVTALKGKRLLLILDNFEQLVVGATLVIELLQKSPELTLLVTSRERLSLTEEWTYLVEGFSVPDEPTVDAEHSDAVKLFVHRAKRVQLDFRPNQETLPHVHRICKLVDGLPLGIELAATWIRVMSVGDIANELIRSLDLLETSERNVSEKQKSIRATFEYSWGLLSSREQEVLRRLSVFVGGFTREAASQTADASLPLLAALVDKSLLRLLPNGRYDCHPLLYQYLKERLTNQVSEFRSARNEHAEANLEPAQEGLVERRQEAHEVRKRHAVYFTALLDRLYSKLVNAELEAKQAAERDLENVRAAWFWAAEHREATMLKEMALPLGRLFENRPLEALDMFARAAAVLDEGNPGHHAALGYILVLQAWLLNSLSMSERALSLVEQGLSFLRPLEEYPGLCKALSVKAWNLWFYHSESARAKRLWQESVSLARQHKVKSAMGEPLAQLVVVEMGLGTFAEIKKLADRTLSELEALGNHMQYTKVLCWSGDNLSRNGYLEEGKRRILEAVRLARTYRLVSFLPIALFDAAEATYRSGDYEQAELYARECVAISREKGIRYAEGRGLNYLGRVMTKRGDHLGAQAYLADCLEIACQIDDYFGITANMVAQAELELSQCQYERAVQWLTLVSHHKRAEKHVREEARRFLDALKSRMAPEAFTEAVSAGENMQLEGLIEEWVSRRDYINLE